MAEFDVVEFDAADRPETGDEAPEFTRPLVTNEGWRDVGLSELLADAPVLLVFYPMNGSGKSIYTWTEIRDRNWDACTVAGVSISQPFDQMRFVEDHDLSCGIFSDPANGVAADYGIVHDLDGMSGIGEPRPAVFLVGEGGTVRYDWVADEWPEMPPFDEIEDELERI